MQSPTICVPSKTTDEVDWMQPLRQYISQTYQEDPQKYYEECSAIQRLRQDMRGAGRDATGRDLLYRYYGQIQMLDLRFPVDENHIRISFNWYDAFQNKPIAQFSLAYEKASVLFNIAATLSAIGSAQNRSDPEGVKKAFNAFQASAGVFTYINDNFLHAPSNDLSRDTVKVLVALTLAQAQEIFWEKTVGEKKKSGLIAKLAAQAHLGYTTALEGVQELQTKAIVEKTWLVFTQTKQKYFGSMMQYYRAMADDDSNNYGHAVARLTIAETYAKEAAKLATQFSSLHGHATANPSISAESGTNLAEITKLHSQLMTEKKNTATHDNDLIYHGTVPSESALPAIDKLNATKATDILELYTQAEMERIVGPDIFTRLIPLAVHESASLYSEEKAKLTRAEAERVEVADGELVNALEYMKLPSGLEKFRRLAEGNADGNDPINHLAEPSKDVKQWADSVHQTETQKGAIRDLDIMLNGLKTRSQETLDELGIVLDTEQRDCEQMRVKYRDAWTQAPSGPLTQAYRNDIKQHRETMSQAANSDAHLVSLRDQNAKDIAILSQGSKSDDLYKLFAEALAALGPPPSPSLIDTDEATNAAATIKTHIANVEDCLGKLNKIKRERKETLNDLKDKTHEDDISHALVFNKNKPHAEKELFAAELEKFRPYQQRLTGLIHHQQAILPELTSHYKALLEGKEARAVQGNWDQSEKRQREVTERLRRSKEVYFEVQDGLTKGIQFYSDLADLVDKLAGDVKRFADQRAQERKYLVDSLESTRSARDRDRLKEQLNRYASSPTPSAPAPSVSSLASQTSQMSLHDPYANLNGSGSRPSPAPVHTAQYAPQPQPSYAPPSQYQSPPPPPQGYSPAPPIPRAAAYQPPPPRPQAYSPAPTPPQPVSAPYQNYSSPPPLPPNPLRQSSVHRPQSPQYQPQQPQYTQQFQPSPGPTPVPVAVPPRPHTPQYQQYGSPAPYQSPASYQPQPQAPPAPYHAPYQSQVPPTQYQAQSQYQQQPQQPYYQQQPPQQQQPPYGYQQPQQFPVLQPQSYRPPQNQSQNPNQNHNLLD